MNTQDTITVRACLHASSTCLSGRYVDITVPSWFTMENMFDIFDRINNSPLAGYYMEGKPAWLFCRWTFPIYMIELENGERVCPFDDKPMTKKRFLSAWRKVWDALDCDHNHSWEFCVWWP